MTTPHPFLAALEKFGGVCEIGKHPLGSRCACVLEIAAYARTGGEEWTDEPHVAGLPDMRPLNDSRAWTREECTRELVPSVIALWGWPEWSDDHRVDWSRAVALRTIREILPIALRAAGLEAHATACEKAETLDEAAEAAAAANADARYAYAAAYANAAANAAAYANAAHAVAATAKSSEPLILACKIWREEAERIEAARTGGRK